MLFRRPDQPLHQTQSIKARHPRLSAVPVHNQLYSSSDTIMTALLLRCFLTLLALLPPSTAASVGDHLDTSALGDGSKAAALRSNDVTFHNSTWCYISVNSLSCNTSSIPTCGCCIPPGLSPFSWSAQTQLDNFGEPILYFTVAFPRPLYRWFSGGFYYQGENPVFSTSLTYSINSVGQDVCFPQILVSSDYSVITCYLGDCNGPCKLVDGSCTIGSYTFTISNNNTSILIETNDASLSTDLSTMAVPNPLVMGDPNCLTISTAEIIEQQTDTVEVVCN